MNLKKEYHFNERTTDIVTETMKEDVKQVVLIKCTRAIVEVSERERRGARGRDRAELRRYGGDFDETSKEVDTLIVKFHNLCMIWSRVNRKSCRETLSFSERESKEQKRFRKRKWN